MSAATFYHDGMIALQEAADGRRLADLLADKVRHDSLTETDSAFIAAAGFFFIATSCDDQPDCSFKGGPPGFVRVTSPTTLEFPDYDGNSMYRTLGNIARNPRVGLLFIQLDATPNRLRVNGLATLHRDAAGLAAHHAACTVIRVECVDIFPNCPRYIPDLASGHPSRFVPAEGVAPPIPEWKTYAFITPVLPSGDQHRAAILAGTLPD